MSATASDAKTPKQHLLGADTSLPGYATQIGTAQVLLPLHVKRRESIWRRHMLAFVLFGVAILVVVGGRKFWHGQRDLSFYQMDEYPLPPTGGSFSDCDLAEWSTAIPGPRHPQYPHSDSVSLEVPLAPETLMFFSHGALSSGRLQVTSSSEISDIARFDITVHYYNPYIRDKARICLVERKEGENGVGIYTPMHRHSPHGYRDRVHFEVVLTLPEGYLNRLETDVSNFSHDLESLAEIVDFGEILLHGSNGMINLKDLVAGSASLRTSNGPITATHLVASSVDVHSANGPITGNFTAVDRLDLVTSNGPVRVNVLLKGSDSKEVNKLNVRTSNSPLEASIRLGEPSGSGGSFSVETTTSNNRLATKVVSTPLDAVLNLQARTSNSPGQVALPVTYEGDLEVYTSNSAVNIHPSNSGAEDPAGKGRKRVVQTAVITRGRAAKGSVYWDEANKHRGKVVLRSSNGPATIYV
ncbi:hypothetical protein FB45DRAFT_888785 [Roridomyces roridus]|uniref:DUF4097 domain-containing protein n=1 Tax=Roridomyces roridus TaxID=1738132 RepID=A0AAD7CMJ7_9AGAR|nr:hypothetical protein FB45DRAFT_888785 [Roridomyces roridus]